MRNDDDERCQWPRTKRYFGRQEGSTETVYGYKSAWTILEKDRHGNRRESCSLTLKCKLKVKEWDQDPYELRKEAIAQDRRRYQDMVEDFKDQQNKKKQRKKEIEEAWNIIRDKRRAHFEKHVDREMKKQYMSVCKSVIEAMTVASKREIKHTKILMPQAAGSISCMIPLTSISLQL